MRDTILLYGLWSFAIIGVFSTILAVPRWIYKRWQRRHDKGYDASKWGAF